MGSLRPPNPYAHLVQYGGLRTPDPLQYQGAVPPGPPAIPLMAREHEARLARNVISNHTCSDRPLPTCKTSIVVTASCSLAISGIAGGPGGAAPRYCRGSGGRSPPVLQGVRGAQPPRISLARSCLGNSLQGKSRGAAPPGPLLYWGAAPRPLDPLHTGGLRPPDPLPHMDRQAPNGRKTKIK